MSGRSGTAQYSNAFHAPIIRRHPRRGSNLTGHAESGLRATGDAFPLVPDVDDNLIGTQKEPGLKDRARVRGAVLLVPAIWAALDRPSSLSPVPTVICHCDELRWAAGLLGYGVDRVTHRSTGLESPTVGPCTHQQRENTEADHYARPAGVHHRLHSPLMNFRPPIPGQTLPETTTPDPVAVYGVRRQLTPRV